MLASKSQAATQVDCHCNMFNYCVDERCTCWNEVIRSNGHTVPEDEGIRHHARKQCCGGSCQGKTALSGS